MTAHTPFKPHYGTNQIATSTAVSAIIPLKRSNKSVRVLNTGSQIAYFATYVSAYSTYIATTADCPILPGEALIIEKFQDADTMAHISPAGTTLQVMTGEGGFN